MIRCHFGSLPCMHSPLVIASTPSPISVRPSSPCSTVPAQDLLETQRYEPHGLETQPYEPYVAAPLRGKGKFESMVALKAAVAASWARLNSDPEMK